MIPVAVGKIVDGYATGDTVSFFWYVALITGVPTVSMVYAYLSRVADVDFEDDIDNGILEKYLRKFVMLDRSYAESIGTGRMMDILSGHRAWRGLLYMVIISFTMSFFVTFFSMVVLWRINWVVSVIAGVLAMLAVYTLMRLNTSVIRYRMEAKEIGTEVMRQCVKVLNSKDEILANAAIDSEMNHLKNLKIRHKKPLYKVISMVE